MVGVKEGEFGNSLVTWLVYLAHKVTVFSGILLNLIIYPSVNKNTKIRRQFNVEFNVIFPPLYSPYIWGGMATFVNQ